MHNVRVCCTIWEEESYAQWQSILKIRGSEGLQTQSFKCLKVETLWKFRFAPWRENCTQSSWVLDISFLIYRKIFNKRKRFLLSLMKGGNTGSDQNPDFKLNVGFDHLLSLSVWSVLWTDYFSKWGQRWSTSPKPYGWLSGLFFVYPLVT